MTHLLTRFWRALEELPQKKTERLDWRERLTDEWPMAERLLRRTGRLVDAVACPSPGGDGCPRKIVRHGDGRIVAVCGDRPQRCETLLLQPDDIEVLELDEPTLRDELRRLLALDDPSVPVPPAKLAFVGLIPVRAGLGLPVLLGFPTADTPISAHDVPALSVGQMPGVVLTPTGSFVDGLPVGWTSLSLLELVGADDRHRMVAHDAAAALFNELKIKATATGKLSDDVIWGLPADARWEEMIFEFTAAEVINVRFRRETRRFEPEHLGMKDKKNGRPIGQWTLLQSFAANRGRLGWAGLGAKVSVKKQKQELSRKLCAAFGISTGPIDWDYREKVYRTRFVISGDVLERAPPPTRSR